MGSGVVLCGVVCHMLHLMPCVLCVALRACVVLMMVVVDGMLTSPSLILSISSIPWLCLIHHGPLWVCSR